MMDELRLDIVRDPAQSRLESRGGPGKYSEDLIRIMFMSNS